MLANISDSVVKMKRKCVPLKPRLSIDPKTTLATILFENGVLSQGKAAKLAGMYLVDFIEHVSRLGVPIVDLTEEELLQDIDVLNRWLEE